MAINAGKQIGNRYELLSQLGRGGMGIVWRARDRLLGRVIALKEVEFPSHLPAAEIDLLKRRVLREARAAALLNHPVAVTVYDVLEEDGSTYIAMELVDAPTLADLVEQKGALSAERTAEVGLQVLDALNAAHAQGIVHRDVKPGNVMVAPDGRVKLADFGIATVKGDPALTATGTLLGSPAYMSPEQALGKEAAPASDLWSLGATLYFAVEGQPPFEKGQPIATLGSIVYDDPPRPTQAGALAPVIEALLVKEPDQRPATEALRLELERVIAGGDEASTVPESRSDTTQKLTADELAALAPPPTTVPAPVAATEVDEPEHGSDGYGDEAEEQARRRRALSVAVGLVALALLGLVVMSQLGEDGGRARPERAGRGNQRAQVEKQQEPEEEDLASPQIAQPPPDAVEPASDWESYEIGDTGYTISYPPDWSVREDPLGDASSTRFADTSGRYLLVDWTDEPRDDAAEAWRQQAAGFAQRHEGYNEIRIEPVEFQEFDTAAEWEFTYVDGGVTLHAIDLGFANDDWGFALLFQTHEEDWDASQEIFEQFKASFAAPS